MLELPNTSRAASIIHFFSINIHTRETPPPPKKKRWDVAQKEKQRIKQTMICTYIFTVASKVLQPAANGTDWCFFHWVSKPAWHTVILMQRTDGCTIWKYPCDMCGDNATTEQGFLSPFDMQWNCWRMGRCEFLKRRSPAATQKRRNLEKKISPSIKWIIKRRFSDPASCADEQFTTCSLEEVAGREKVNSNADHLMKRVTVTV